MGRLADLHAYTTAFRDEAERRDLYPSGGWGSDHLKMIRRFSELRVDAVEAVAWWALHVGPSVVAQLAGRGTAAEFGAYAERMFGADRALEETAVALGWFGSGQPVEVAAAWHRRGYTPERAAALIVEGVDLELIAVVDDAGRRAAVRELTERWTGLIVDPDLADQIGLDDDERGVR
ncbi:hypothetical protein I0C86_41080 [Plantactinospora sp. S1510]|uniref:Uncharacterized protein n=1 Tax=Plantactinospora alkalitolerans TaxID=2789879 RepID=A0ABS0H9T7_9ACTN|nr:hypothetical protein [Plantactinospora alkalitolerans]MBF9135246.1 hypothetical protein [Plantactinospora alkalitolerans]